MEWAGLCAIVGVAAVVGIAFSVDPRLDLDTALYFHRLFAEAPHAPWYDLIAAVRAVNHYLTFGCLMLTLAALAIKLAWPRLPMLLPPRATALVLVAMLLGPGLLVNGLLKETCARPRPGEVVELKGALDFKAWWDTSGECRSNCSFASGETASAFALLAVAAVAPMPWTVPALTAAVALGAAVGIGRVVTTGHFVTDVVFAAILSSLIVWIAHGVLFRWPQTRLSDAAFEAWLTRIIEIGRRRTVAAFARVA